MFLEIIGDTSMAWRPSLSISNGKLLNADVDLNCFPELIASAEYMAFDFHEILLYSTHFDHLELKAFKKTRIFVADL